MQRGLVLVVWCLLLFGCAPRDVPGEIQVAIGANEAFYAQVRGGHYDSIYAQSSDEFKSAVAKNDLVGLFKKVSQKTASCAGPTLTLTSYHLGGGIVDLTYAHKCANAPQITETFSWKIVGNHALLNSYSVDGSI